MNRMNQVVAAASAAVLMAGCGSSAKDVARFQGTSVEQFSVAIVAVDGAPVSASPSLEPGLRKVTVAMPAAAGFKPGEQRTIDLDVKACTKYWLVAARDPRVGPDFAVKVDHEQRVYNCALRKTD